MGIVDRKNVMSGQEMDRRNTVRADAIWRGRGACAQKLAEPCSSNFVSSMILFIVLLPVKVK